MIAVSASFGAGFIAAQTWAWYSFREALADADASYLRYALVVGVETLIAALTFAVAVRAAHLVPSSRAYVLAFVAGAVTNAITVGSYAVVPRLMEGDAQLILHVLAVGVLAALMGWVLAKLSQKKVSNAS